MTHDQLKEMVKAASADGKVDQWQRRGLISDTTYKLHCQKLNRMYGDPLTNIFQIARIWRTFQWAGRNIPLPPETPEGSFTVKEQTKIFNPVSDEMYQSWCSNYLHSLEKGDVVAAQLWEMNIENAGREVPKSDRRQGDRRQAEQDVDVSTPQTDGVGHGNHG